MKFAAQVPFLGPTTYALCFLSATAVIMDLYLYLVLDLLRSLAACFSPKISMIEPFSPEGQFFRHGVYASHLYISVVTEKVLEMYKEGAKLYEVPG